MRHHPPIDEEHLMSTMNKETETEKHKEGREQSRRNGERRRETETERERQRETVKWSRAKDIARVTFHYVDKQFISKVCTNFPNTSTKKQLFDSKIATTGNVFSIDTSSLVTIN